MLALALLTLLSCGSSLRRADRLFDAGAYAEAAAAYEQALGAADGRGGADRVLLRLALAYALPESPVHDEARARVLFDELTRRFESGPYRSQAALILDLRQEIDRLLRESASCREQLEKLKAIDVDGSPR